MIEKIELRIRNLELLKNQKDNIENCIKLIENTFSNNKKLLLCGNGGSASFSNHLAAEFVSKFKLNRNSYPACSLCCNDSIVTAISNDYSFDYVFKRQIESLGEKDDILIAFSTSAKSRNIIEAIKQAKIQGLKVIFFTGKNKSSFDVDIEINAPSDETAQIQEFHVIIGHIICEKIENEYMTKNLR